MPVGNAAGAPIDSWINPTSILIGVLAVVTGAYISAVYLAGDADRAGCPTWSSRSARARSARVPSPG